MTGFDFLLSTLYSLLPMLRRFYNWLYPELALFPTEAARRVAKRALDRVAVSSMRIWFVSVTMMLVVLPIVIIIPVPQRGYLYLAVLIASIVVTLVVGRMTLLILRRLEVQTTLRKCLREQGVPICLHCGYDLQGRAGDKCPECGNPHGI